MNQCCRVCLARSVRLLDLFEEKEMFEGEEHCLADMLNYSLHSKVTLDDKYPKKICEPCIVDLKTTYKVARICERMAKEQESMKIWEFVDR